jgi:hypothetical protein
MFAMKIFIFKCSDKTQSECLSKSLFGAQEDWPLREVRPNSTCILYNFKSKVFFGIWQATEAISKSIEPTAFQGKFPYQVRVQQISSNILSIPESCMKKIAASSFTSKSPIFIEPNIELDDLKKLFVDNGIASSVPETKYPTEKDGVLFRSYSEEVIFNALKKRMSCSLQMQLL